jgi:hypothetical protein
MKNNSQNKSVFARIWRSKYQRLYGTVNFLLLYLLILYGGCKYFYAVAVLDERAQKRLGFLVIVLIILASSLLTKMFLDWSRDVKQRDQTEREK